MHHPAAAALIVLEWPAEGKSKAPALRQYPARMRCDPPACFMCIESEIFIRVEASYAVKHPIMDRTNSKTKNYSAPNVNNAKIEKPILKIQR